MIGQNDAEYKNVKTRFNLNWPLWSVISSVFEGCNSFKTADFKVILYCFGLTLDDPRLDKSLPGEGGIGRGVSFLLPSHSLILVSCFSFCAGKLWSLMNLLILKGQWKDHEADLESNQLVCTCLHDQFGKMSQDLRAPKYKKPGELRFMNEQTFFTGCV